MTYVLSKPVFAVLAHSGCHSITDSVTMVLRVILLVALFLSILDICISHYGGFVVTTTAVY